MSDSGPDPSLHNVSVKDMQAEQIDELLDQLTASAQEELSGEPAESTAEPVDDASYSDTETEVATDTQLAEPEPSGDQQQADPEEALGRVDKDLAELEQMLSGTITEIDDGGELDQEEAEAELQDEADPEEEDEDDEEDETDLAGASEADNDSQAAERDAAEEAPAEASTATESSVASAPENEASPAGPDSLEDLPDPLALDGYKPSCENQEPAEAEPELSDSPRSTHARLTRLVQPVVDPMISLLVLLDAPFGRVSPEVKHLLGYVAVATLIIAVATWLVAHRLQGV